MGEFHNNSADDENLDEEYEEILSDGFREITDREYKAYRESLSPEEEDFLGFLDSLPTELRQGVVLEAIKDISQETSPSNHKTKGNAR